MSAACAASSLWQKRQLAACLLCSLVTPATTIDKIEKGILMEASIIYKSTVS